LDPILPQAGFAGVTVKTTRARKSAYADAVIQLTLDFDSPEDERLRQRFDPDKGSDEL
jgi:hypothetical protein